MSEKEWEQLLRSIHVRSLHSPLLGPLIKGPVVPAWSDEEARYLSQTLSIACSDATPEEWVVFAFRRTSSAGLTEITSGAWYVADTHIHLRLANYRLPVTLPGLQKLMWENPTRSQGDMLYEVVPGEHHAFVNQADTSLLRSTPPDLAIDYESLRNKDATVPRTSGAAEEKLTPATAPSSLDQRLNTLKRLREQGLITEEDYRAKKQQILKAL